MFFPVSYLFLSAFKTCTEHGSARALGALVVIHVHNMHIVSCMVNIPENWIEHLKALKNICKIKPPDYMYFIFLIGPPPL